MSINYKLNMKYYTYNNFSNDTRLAKGTEEEGDEAREDDNHAYLKDEEWQCKVQPVVPLPRSVRRRLHRWLACCRCHSNINQSIDRFQQSQLNCSGKAIKQLLAC